MKKIVSLYLMILGVATGIMSCCHDDDPEEDPIAECTVLIYMAAENDLSSFAINDLEEMKQASRALSNRQKSLDRKSVV